MSNWKRVRVEQIASSEPNSLATGPFGSSISAKYFVDTGVPVIRGSNLSEDVGVRLLEEKLVFLTSEKAATFTRSEARKGDLIFTCWGTIGQVGLIDQRAKYDTYIVSNKQMKLTPDPEKADSLFLYYAFSNPYMVDTIKGQAIGSSVPGFNLGQLRRVEIDLPPLNEQRRIAYILGTLDDKIESNRRTNETLEAMARTIFKSWFIDFDPVRAKADGRLPTGMGAETASLFPCTISSLSDLSVPSGWSIKPLVELTSYLARGISPAYVDDGGVCVVNQKCIRAGQVDVSKARRHDPDRRSINGREVYVGDILVNSTGVGTLGRVAQVLELEETTIVDSHVTIIRPNPELVLWTYLGTNLGIREAEIEGLGEGSTGQTELSRSRLGQLPVLVPSIAVQMLFDDFVLPLRLRQVSNVQENRMLSELRDTLLPKLLTGEIRIQQAEKQLEAAL